MKSKKTNTLPKSGSSAKKLEKIKSNPFEVHINRSKHKVLGQKIKGERGLPGISRGKAVSKREKILLPKYRDRYKETRFLDRRIGERNKNLDHDEMLLMRIAAGKKKQFSKKSYFLLNDDDELTHAGKALDEDIMKDQSLFSDDDDIDVYNDDEDKDMGRLGPDFVKSQHFGGGVLMDPVKSADANKTDQTSAEGPPKSRKEWLDEMVAESKKKKAANKYEKEIQYEAVAQLDSKFQDFLSLMKGRVMTDEDKAKVKKTCDFRDYDITVNELNYDRSRRACPTDRLKTAEEIAKEEKERLEKLEKDRQRRMRGEVENANDHSAVSADRLDDGYEIFLGNQKSSVSSKCSKQPAVNCNKNPDANVKFKALEGKIRTKPAKEDIEEEVEEGSEVNGEEESEVEGEEESEVEGEEESEVGEEESELEGEEESEVGEEESEVEGEEESEVEVEGEEESEVEGDEESEVEGEEESEVEGGEKSEMEKGVVEKVEEGSEVEEVEEGTEGEEDEEGSEVEEDEGGSEVEEVEVYKGKKLNGNKDESGESDIEDKEEEEDKCSQIDLASESEDEYSAEQEERVDAKEHKSSEEERLSKLKKMVDKAKQEIPFTFEVPLKYEEFWTLILGRNPQEVSTIVQRMIKCNHPSLGADNGMKANTIFAYILQTLHDICVPNSEELYPGIHSMAYIDPLVPYLYDLTQLSFAAAADTLNQVIDEKYQEYSSQKFKTYPNCDTFIFLKVSGILFPASDFCHRVMTRVFTFLIHLLGQTRVTSGREVVASLFTCSLLFEYLNRSAKFVGELMNTLNGLLYLSIPDGPSKLTLPINPPFKPHRPSAQLLVLEDSFQKSSSLKLKFSLLNNNSIEVDDNFKVGALNETLKLLDRLCHKWVESPAIRAIFAPTTLLLNNIAQDKYPPETIALIEALRTSIAQLPKQVPHLFKENRVKSLRMLTPISLDVFDGVMRRGATREVREREKLEHKLKRERKGARRELKRDAQFLGRQRLKETLQSDAERKRKVNLIMAGLSSQESEYQKWKKMKMK